MSSLPSRCSLRLGGAWALAGRLEEIEDLSFSMTRARIPGGGILRDEMTVVRYKRVSSGWSRKRIFPTSRSKLNSEGF